jgi:hypothetical protein
MNLAAIIALYLLGLGWSPPLVRSFARHASQQPAGATDSNSAATQGSSSPSQPQTPTDSTKPAAPTSEKKLNSAGQAKPPAQRRRYHKNTVYPDCTISPPPLNPLAGNPAGPATSTSSVSPGAASTNAGGSTTGSGKSRAPLKPCPPPKKVVRNGGSNEPTIQLMGGTPAEQASRQRSTDELSAATEENLKKIADRELSPTQRDMLNQIKQFMQESKTAVASGDAERGHDLAMKARLLSDELVKP